ncbi:glutamate-ammonia-ligase adenylyltransferase [Kineococcus xinjiangensis]|uniref:Bifunctional glutamine synthetase adenylyltransferase/adenylyl-removing enzyme n=1 Tax=Kineococcus xinjiangensis TaxID=512762 RepID=A0A2S6IMI4_9ACTN|nr:bifunctional [glutamine synthetase] adenylyltransferase/[glutamine synthetase]-adenylyl-L-tyrosine phosphorylase [Kineococcus xinjiangensis]PPK95350.1 glutamate-ammonia-ligase adenylyltransferase [Kineococcus xinjiangensis]
MAVPPPGPGGRPAPGRRATGPALLARCGFDGAERALRLLEDAALREVLTAGREPAVSADADRLLDEASASLVRALGLTADPDAGLLALVRWCSGVVAGPDVEDVRSLLQAATEEEAAARARLLAVLGGSGALADHLVRHPAHWRALLAADPPARGHARAELLAAVGADPDADVPVAGRRDPAADGGAGQPEPVDALRVAYRRRLLALAGRDLASEEPTAAMPSVAAELADLAAAALEAALAIARSELPDGGAGCRLAVLGMGKTGGRELNYLSDVDVVYVVEPAEGADAAEALATGGRLAAALQRACSAHTAEGSLWEVDAGLRPEGKNGPLVRTLDSHLEYYRRWAKTWEFQALLKARPVAGDAELGRAYVEALRPMVWSASEREGFVEDVQAMRRRVESHIPAKDAGRQLKLGPGGLRDVEFSVQLLQMVHGRADSRLRSPNTLEALEELTAYGYIGRHDAAELDRHYRLLRSLEHRLQLHRLRRTHVLPTAEADLRRLGRALGLRATPVQQLEDLLRGTRRDVRRLHEKLFYRPLLSAVARLSVADAGLDVRLTPEAARERMAALGYRDPAGALRHLEALTSGVSRRASIQRTLLPVMLQWFADGADPDAGLLAYRRVSDHLGGSQWYLTMLRDSGAAAERLAHVLSAAELPAELLLRSPESVAVFADDDRLAPYDREQVVEAMEAAVQRRPETPAGSAAGPSPVLAARGVRRRELLRTSVADLVGLRDLDGVGRALADADDALLEVTLRAAVRTVERREERPLPTRLLVVGMGRLGGRETGYGSDADVLFVHEPVPGADEGQAQAAAQAVVAELRRSLSEAGPEPGLDVDADLRPEGRQGPLVRSLESYRAYYARWSAPWEAQALLRARPVAGDVAGLGARFRELVDPLRWPAAGLSEANLREVRRIKARVEGERLPRGADPLRHIKLGRGGIADVEWTVQVLQLAGAAEHPGLRTTSTVPALAAAVEAGLLDAADGAELRATWEFTSRVRNAVVLWHGKAKDSLPAQRSALDGVARIMGWPPGSAREFEEEYLRVTRHARAVVQRVFYGD